MIIMFLVVLWGGTCGGEQNTRVEVRPWILYQGQVNGNRSPTYFPDKKPDNPASGVIMTDLERIELFIFLQTEFGLQENEAFAIAYA